MHFIVVTVYGVLFAGDNASRISLKTPKYVSHLCQIKCLHKFVTIIDNLYSPYSGSKKVKKKKI